MKKPLLLILFPLLFVAGCAPEPEEPLPDPKPTSYSVKLTADIPGLTDTLTEEPLQVEITSEQDKKVKYQFEIGSPAKLNTKSEVCNQIQLKPGAYIKSLSTYKVSKLVVDFFPGQGINYQVFNNTEKTGDPVEYHTSKIESVDPSTKDEKLQGIVYEYPISAKGWCIYNHTEYNNPTFYSVQVIFEK